MEHPSMSTQIDITGRFEVLVEDLETGAVETYTSPNTLLDSGRPVVADMMRGAISGLSTIVIGSNATAVDPATQTGILTEVARKAIAAPGTNTATDINTRAGNAVTLRVTFGPGLTLTINEAAVYANIPSPPGASGAGSAINRATLGPISITSAQTAKIQSVLTYG
jgi:hypothetical protein